MKQLFTDKNSMIFGAAMALIAVLLGAFGAHGLKEMVDSENIASFTTGVRYQMYHAIGCLLLGSISNVDIRYKKRAFFCFFLGILLFSGSIYLLVLDKIIGISLSSIGFITPLGGLLLIFGWIFFIISLAKIK